MASASPFMDVEEEVKCPICKEYLTDPVSVACGHTFCRVCITHHCETWEDLKKPLECFLCNARIKKGKLRPNWQLANIVEKIKLSLGKEDLCVRHKEKLNKFCKEDQELVCGGCERSPKHQSHAVLLLEKAAEEYKLQFPTYLEFLKKEREDIQASKEATQKEGQDLLDIGGTMQRCVMRERFENPPAFSPELKWRIWDACDLSLFLDGVAKQLKDSLESGFHMQKGEYRNPRNEVLSLSQELKTIRVTLNCAVGRVAFFNADTGAQLDVYSDASFSRETLLPFFYLNAESELRLLF
ncbi:hypothetical protein lerEdw1_009214 [Lerista edwardsae]|nr:hypothetical protein lerEdw1_009214 [Lerista edwardsae]